MFDRILINPQNRILGTAAGDLSLYGAQPAQAGAEPPAAPAAPATADAPVSASGQAPAVSMPGTAAAVVPLAHADAPSMLVAAPSASGAQPAGDLSPASLHASLVPALLPQTGGDSGHDHASPSLPEPLAAAQAQPDPAVAEPTGPLAAAFAPVILPEPAEAQPEAITGIVVSDLNSGADAAEAIAPVVAETGAIIADLTAPLLDGVGPAVANVAAIATEGLPDAVVGPLSDTLGEAGETVSDLLGSDPGAGIATLVSLVTVGDIFDLRDAGSDGGDSGAGANGLMLDTLTADLPADALLGHDPDHDDHAGLLGIGGSGDDGIIHPLGLG